MTPASWECERSPAIDSLLMNSRETNPKIKVRDIGMYVQGNATLEHREHIEGPPVLVHLEEFHRLTGIQASAPASVAILRLLEENITRRQVARIWQDELEFNGEQFQLRIDHYVPVCGKVAVALFAIATLLMYLRIDWFDGGWWVAAAGVSGFFIAAFMLYAYAVLLYLPYWSAMQVLPVLDDVNAELPSILAAWRQQLRESKTFVRGMHGSP